MDQTSRAVKTAFAAFLIIMILAPFQVLAQTQYALSLTMTPQNWDSDMRSIMKTTPEKGLVIQIGIQNNLQGLTAAISTLTFQSQLSYLTTSPSFPTTNVQSLLSVIVPPASILNWYLMVLAPNAHTQLGEYSLKLSYNLGSVSWYDSDRGQQSYGSYPMASGEQSLEPYPFNFIVESQSQLQQDIQQHKQNTGPVFNINIGSLFTIEGGIGSIISISLLAGLAYLIRRRRR